MKRFVRPLVCLHHSGRRTTSVKNNDQTPGVTNNNDVRPSVWRPLPPQKKSFIDGAWEDGTVPVIRFEKWTVQLN